MNSARPRFRIVHTWSNAMSEDELITFISMSQSAPLRTLNGGSDDTVPNFAFPPGTFYVGLTTRDLPAHLSYN